MMKKGLKIVTIGGGSSYTPELMEGFIKRYNELPIKEIWLVDIEQGKEKVNIDAKMSQRMWDAAGYDVKVHVSFFHHVFSFSIDSFNLLFTQLLFNMPKHRR